MEALQLGAAAVAVAGSATALGLALVFRSIARDALRRAKPNDVPAVLQGLAELASRAARWERSDTDARPRPPAARKDRSA